LYFIWLRSDCGDSPGYIREGLESLSQLGKLVDNSDLYRTSAHTHQHYGAIAKVETGMDARELRNALRAIEERYTSERGSNGMRPLKLDMLTLAQPDLAGGETAATLFGALPADVNGSVTRIVGTARRERQATLDYDAPGGAGKGYDELRPLSDFSQRLFLETAGAIELRTGMNILDVGCGTGRFSILFAQRGAAVTGLDRSKTMLAAAQASAPAALHELLHYVHADANEGLPQGNFDAITFFMSIQYIALNEAFLESLHCALAPGGAVAIVTLPHRHFTENEVLTKYFPSIPRIDLARFPSIPELERMLRDHGFGDVNVREVVDENEGAGDELISRVERKYVSTLHLLDDAEFERGLAAMRSEISGMCVRRTMRAAIVSARARPAQPARRNIKRGGTQEGSY
jgi:ubiquinone/menaquinone biosynthesis C-methylase UbiE